MKTTILLTAILFASASACAGQEPAGPTQTPAPAGESKSGGIEGIVTGPDGEPVAGMRVSIVSGTAPFPEIAPETDEKGHYRLSSIAPGTYKVAVHEKQGQRVGLESVGVKSGETATLDFSIGSPLAGSGGNTGTGKGVVDPPYLLRVFPPQGAHRDLGGAFGLTRDISKKQDVSRPGG